MIDRGVRIIDLDPEGFAWLNRCLAARDDGLGEISVLHDGAEVTQVAGSVDGTVAAGDPVGDPHRLATSVAEATGAGRVTVIDSRRLDELSTSVVELGRSCPSQGELLWRARETWNADPGVVTVPPPGPSRWPAVEALLSTVPDGEWVMARVRSTERPPTVVAGRVRAGLLVEITSAEPADDRVAVLLDTDRATVERILGARDPLAELLEAMDSPGTEHRGLAPLRGQA